MRAIVGYLKRKAKENKKALASILIAGAFFNSSFFACAQTLSLPQAEENEVNENATVETPLTRPSRTNGATIERVKKSTRILDYPIQTHSFGLGVGETFLLGDLRHHGHDSITLDLFYSYKASHSFDLLVNFHHSKHKYLDDYSSIQGLGIGIKANLYQFDAITPFALGGPGFYRPKVRRWIDVGPGQRKLVESKGKVAFGMNFGAGIDLRLNEMVSIGLLGQYHNPFDVKQEVGPEVEGSYFKLLMTMMYYL